LFGVGMSFLHSVTPPVLHRDLKSPNILLVSASPDEEELLRGKSVRNGIGFCLSDVQNRLSKFNSEENLPPEQFASQFFANSAKLKQERTLGSFKVQGPSGSTRPVVAKVADFGLSLRTNLPLTTRVVDNPLWLAPELLSSMPYST
jgi:serine/threonine protein kinase